jgi:hypothetical protein
MSGSRPSVFDEDLDLSRFTPKTGPDTPPMPQETMRRVSEEGGFPSRAPKRSGAAPAEQPAARKLPSQKTGRTVLLNARITQRAHDRFHEIIESERLRYEAGEITHRVTLGELVERALAALEREPGQGGKS